MANRSRRDELKTQRRARHARRWRQTRHCAETVSFVVAVVVATAASVAFERGRRCRQDTARRGAGGPPHPVQHGAPRRGAAGLRGEARRHDGCGVGDIREANAGEYRVALVVEPYESKARGLASHPSVVDLAEVAEKVAQVARLRLRRQVANKNLRGEGVPAVVSSAPRSGTREERCVCRARASVHGAQRGPSRSARPALPWCLCARHLHSHRTRQLPTAQGGSAAPGRVLPSAPLTHWIRPVRLRRQINRFLETFPYC